MWVRISARGEGSEDNPEEGENGAAAATAAQQAIINNISVVNFFMM